jgi:hypothetical protein
MSLSGTGLFSMAFQITKPKKEYIVVVCNACKVTKPVLPKDIPTSCPACKSNMYPRRGWEIKK